MTSYKDESTNTWYCQFWYKDWTGKRKHTVKRRFKRKKDADDYERSIKTKTTENRDITVNTVADEYIAGEETRYKLGSIKESTLARKKNNVKLYIKPYFENVIIRNIKTKDINEWISVLVERGNHHSKKEKRLSSETINGARSDLSKIFDFAIVNYGLIGNPVDKSDRVKHYSNDERAKIWTLDQYKTFYDSIDKESYRVFFNVMFWAGLRIGEAKALTPQDILPYKIDVNKAFRKQGLDTIGGPKTESSVRFVEIPKYLYFQIQDYISKQYKIKKTDFIFEKINEATIYSYLRRRCKKLGLPIISSHILRHSYASILYSIEKNILVVQSQLGHKNADMTLKIYSHVLPEDSRKAINSIENLVGNVEDFIDVESQNLD